jgi:ribosomal-protein-alanine N-acetyltransferase
MSQELIEAGLRPTWSAARVTWHIRHAESMVLTARYGDSTVGFAIMGFGDDVAHLNLLAVDPSHRRRGVAARMLAWLEETALTAGTFLVRLELRAGNVAAHSFYAAMGYRELGRVSGYYQGVESAIRMERDVRTGRGAVPGNNGNRNINPA